MVNKIIQHSQSFVSNLLQQTQFLAEIIIKETLLVHKPKLKFLFFSFHELCILTFRSLLPIDVLVDVWIRL